MLTEQATLVPHVYAIDVRGKRLAITVDTGATIGTALTPACYRMVTRASAYVDLMQALTRAISCLSDAEDNEGYGPGTSIMDELVEVLRKSQGG